MMIMAWDRHNNVARLNRLMGPHIVICILYTCTRPSVGLVLVTSKFSKTLDISSQRDQ